MNSRDLQSIWGQVLVARVSYPEIRPEQAGGRFRFVAIRSKTIHNNSQAISLKTAKPHQPQWSTQSWKPANSYIYSPY